ncbi:hypothetical protein Mpal_0895 [Methanosphaerula palustris E1-9c]|uniref:Uncharacterized protein n=1 Tax=Methanosphaerula palustris (strain ATCC BAA-1556 / DSM 19958 / E1-9c) TaxID=521011 RepID=B8GGJ6_METPE|nr:hypothetical protein Mpal_0895 [Methanosphaerula palustris E1-9c]
MVGCLWFFKVALGMASDADILIDRDMTARCAPQK